MTKLLKNISAIVAIVMIISVIAIPAFASVNALSYNVGSEASDLPNNLVAWVTLSYSGANGTDRVDVEATGITNLGNVSKIETYSYAVAASFIGNKVAYKLVIPFVVSTSGSAYYG